MDDINYSGSDVEYETDKKQKKFQITRGMVLLAIIIIIIIIVVIVILASKSSSNKPSYTTDDFNRLEERMIEEAPLYLSQKQIVLDANKIRINLMDLLVENGGSIDSNKVKAAKVCDGYVIAYKENKENYSSYIKCGDMYTTKGYTSSDESTKSTSKTSSSISDKTLPVITLVGEKEMTLNLGSSYEEPGFNATDNIDGNITSKVSIKGSVNSNVVGTYEIIYSVSDKAGNKAEEKRIIKVIQNQQVTTTTKQTTRPSTNKITTKKPITTTAKIQTPPTIVLYGSKYMTINVGTKYSEPGYSATDARGNNITSRVDVSTNINTSSPGTYYVTYAVSDTFGNKASVVRTVIVKQTYIALNSLKITPNASDMSVGSSKTLMVTFSPSNATNKSVSWTSNNPSVASVSNGVVYAKSKGVAIIKVTGADGKEASARITVK